MSYKTVTFKEIKDYFDNAKIPKSVGVDYMIVHDVESAVKNDIELIENLILKRVDLKKSEPANSAKARLYNIMNLCKDSSTHNVTKFKPSKFRQMAIDIKFVSKCIADGCDKNKNGNSQLCKEHEEKKAKGENFLVYNGKKIRE